MTVTAASNGKLPSWREILAPVNLSQSSGLGTYTTTVELPATWQSTDGAYLSLGDVLDSAKVSVNGTEITVNQSDRGRIDLGKTLRPGTNTDRRARGDHVVQRRAPQPGTATTRSPTGSAPGSWARSVLTPVPRHRPADLDVRRRRRHRPGDALAHARRAGLVRRVHAGRGSQLRREHDRDGHLDRG